MKLNEKQRKFVDEYLKTGNAMQSAIAAGYSDNYAKAQSSKLLENVGIKSYLTERRKEIESKRIMSAQQALELLTKIAKGEEKETVIVSSPEGIYESKKEADLKTRIAAVKEILKRYPAENPLTQAQIRKIEAEADIKEAQAAEAKNMTDSSSEVMIVDDIPED
ncbi:terminase small subunit [Latilactobacillus sakei]|nr:terminase small subunit [Latilactobacillus sakei]